jgi:IS1 family transposase
VDLDSFMQKDASREIEVKRPAAVCWKLFLKQARGGQCYTDFWSAYQAVIRSASTMQRLGKKLEKRRVLERWKNTLRQRLARFVRKTLSFSRIHVHA